MGLGRITWKNEVPDEQVFEAMFGMEWPDDVELEVEIEPEEVELTEEEQNDLALEARISSKDSYDNQQWFRACVIHDGYDENEKDKHALPVAAPDGTLDPKAMRGAVKKLINGSWPQEKKKDAARSLVNMFRRIDENPPDSLLGLAGMVRDPYRYDYSDMSEEHEYVFTPFTEDETDVQLLAKSDADDGKVYFWKQLLPYRKFRYKKDGQDRIVNITRTMGQKIAANFGKALGMVPVLMTSSGSNHHDDSPANTSGEIEKIEARKDGIYGLCAVDAAKAAILKKFPKMGVSVGLNTNYVRSEDQKKFGPIIFHAAVTPRPYLNGMNPWQLVSLFDGITNPQEVVNLSQEEYEVLEAEEVGDDGEATEGGTQVKVTVKDGQIVLTDDDGNEVELTDEQRQEIAAAAGPAPTDPNIEGRVTTLSEQLAQERRERREERNSYRMSSEYREVAPAVRRTLLPLINLAENQESDEQITLQEGDNARQVPPAKALWELAEYMKRNHPIPLDQESGNSGGESPQDEREDKRIADLAEQYAKDHNVDYYDALLEVQRMEAEPQAS